MKDKEVFTTTGRRFVGILEINGIDYLTYYISEEVFLIENNPSLKITKNDTQQYSAVMIFPIYLNNKIEGVVICFREKGNYIASSSQAPNTVRKWIMKYMGNNIFPI